MVNECAGERYAKDVKHRAKKDHHEEDGFETANCRMDHHPSETAWGNLSHPQSISEANASQDSSEGSRQVVSPAILSKYRQRSWQLRQVTQLAEKSQHANHSQDTDDSHLKSSKMQH